MAVGAALDDDEALLGGAVAHLTNTLGKAQLVWAQLLQATVNNPEV